jgi:probable HAF family extracellular repeat protein
MIHPTKILLMTAFGLLSVLFCAGSAHAQPRYTVTRCPIYSPAGINILGEVTGRVNDPNTPTGYRINGGYNIAVCLNGKVTDLVKNPALGYPNVSWGSGINDFGEVVGEYRTPEGQYPCLSKPGQPLKILLNVPNTFNAASATNNLGDVVVTLPSPVSEDNAAIYRNDVVTYLGNLPGGYGSIGLGINDRDQVVGEALGDASSISDNHAFLWQNGRITDLGSFGNNVQSGGSWSAAHAINNQGQVVGEASTSDTFARVVPFLWQNGVLYNLGMLPAVPGSYLQTGAALASNNLGEIVGTCTSQGVVVFNTSPFLYVGGKMYDLNSLLVPNSGYVITNVFGINDLGVIVAQSSDAGVVLLTPILHWLLPPIVKH